MSDEISRRKAMRAMAGFVASAVPSNILSRRAKSKDVTRDTIAGGIAGAAAVVMIDGAIGGEHKIDTSESETDKNTRERLWTERQDEIREKRDKDANNRE